CSCQTAILKLRPTRSTSNGGLLTSGTFKPDVTKNHPAMFNRKTTTTLKTEDSKLAKLSNVQGSLPPIMRGLPVLAILAGEAADKATGSNKVEELMLGADEPSLLGVPPKKAPASTMTNADVARPGVKMMCQICAAS